jgi:hypothetical protein
LQLEKGSVKKAEKKKIEKKTSKREVRGLFPFPPNTWKIPSKKERKKSILLYKSEKKTVTVAQDIFFYYQFLSNVRVLQIKICNGL